MSESSCVLCNHSTDDPLQLGEKLTSEDTTAHLYCLVSRNNFHGNILAVLFFVYFHSHKSNMCCIGVIWVVVWREVKSDAQSAFYVVYKRILFIILIVCFYLSNLIQSLGDKMNGGTLAWKLDTKQFVLWTNIEVTKAIFLPNIWWIKTKHTLFGNKLFWRCDWLCFIYSVIF